MLVLEMEKYMEKKITKNELSKLTCLVTVGRFGWLRVQEIALFLWFKSSEKSRYQYAIKLVKRLEKLGYVYLQALPEHGGTAVLLRPNGKKFALDYLNKIGTPRKKPLLAKASSSNDYFWEPTARWKHDLMAHGLCAHLYHGELSIPGTKFLTELECKNSKYISTNISIEFSGERKIPDLLMKTAKGVLGIEVERSHKRGKKNKHPLVDVLIKTNQNDGEAPHIFHGLKPDIVVVAYEKSQKYKGETLNHYENIKNSVQKQAETIEYACETVKFCTLELTIKNFGVIGYKYDEETLIIVDNAG